MIANNGPVLQHIIRELSEDLSEPVAIDTETTGLRMEPGGDVVRGFSIAYRDRGYYVPLTHPNTMNADTHLAKTIVKLVAMHDTVAMWNSAFDRYGLFLAYGIHFPDEAVWDGQTVDWVMNESADHRLKFVGKRVFGLDAAKEKEELDALFKGRSVGECYAELRAQYLLDNALPRLPKGEGALIMEQARSLAAASKRSWDTVSADEIAAYAVQDARLTLDLFLYQQDWLTDNPEYAEGLPREFLVEGLALRMRMTGVAVNQEIARAGMTEALERIEELAALWPGVNLRSAPQVQALIYDEWGLPCTRKTKAGGRSTNKQALSELAYDPRVAGLMEFRKLVKQVDAFYVPILNKLASDGRLHPSWNAHRVRTGRWSCSGPNMQQVPAKPSPLRDMFVAADGFQFVSADLPNAELRVCAIIAQEPVWLNAFLSGADLHQTTADAAGIDRRSGKTQNFQNLYGGGPKKLAESLAMNTGTKPDYAAAKQMWRAFWKALPRVRRLMDGLGEAWVRHGRLQIQPWPGRFRHRLDMRTGFPEPDYKALNSIIQGSVGEAVKDWMLHLEPRVHELGGRIVAQVHDSLVLEVPVGTEDKAAFLLQDSWDAINPFNELPWPLDVMVGAF